MINESTGNNLHNLTQKDCIIAATMIIIDIPTKNELCDTTRIQRLT
jgi:hypothetical protein